MANPRIDELRKRLEREPGSRLFAQLAEELRKDGMLQEAIRVCREGLQKQPNYPSARMTLGRALFDAGDLGAARVELEGVLRGAPDNILAGRLLGECLERQGDPAGALARFKATLALAPGDRQILEKVHALEVGKPAADPAATLVMPAEAASRRQPLEAASPIEATLVDVPTPFQGEEAVDTAEPAPIPLSPVDDLEFELERPYESAPTAIGGREGFALAGASAPAAPAVAAASPEEAPIPLSEADESFELERPYEAPATVLGGASRATDAASPPQAQTDAEALLDLETGPGVPAPDGPAPAEAGEPSPAAPSGAADADLNTVTLAELYLSQGVMDKAMEVYRQVLERDPHNARARTRLAEIEALDNRIRAEQAQGSAEGPAGSSSARRQAIERTIARLEALLAALRRG